MHNFYLVDYRVSIDAIPGRYNIIWINTPQLNGYNQLNYTILCKELCGVWHYDMRAQLVVLDPISFSQWLNNQTLSATSTTMTSGGG